MPDLAIAAAAEALFVKSLERDVAGLSPQERTDLRHALRLALAAAKQHGNNLTLSKGSRHAYRDFRGRLDRLAARLD